MKFKKTKETKTKKEDLTEVIDKITENFDDELLEETRELKEIMEEEVKEEPKKSEEPKKVEEPKKEIVKQKEEKVMARPKKKFKLDMSIIIFIFVLVLIGGIVIFLTVGHGGSKYGERLKGIEKISFTKKDKDKFINSIKSNENVNSASIDIQGKIIYVIVDVKENVSIEDARNILNGSLENLSDKVKNYYDLNALITKKAEVPTEEVKTDADGKETKVEHRDFPISGYKNNSSDHIVW